MIKEIQLRVNLVEGYKENILLYKVSKQLLQVAEEKTECLINHFKHNKI